MISYENAIRLKELGFPQKKYASAKYYIAPDMIINFEDIHDFKTVSDWAEKRHEVQVNWMDKFTYIPELVDLLGIQSYDLTLDAAVYQWIENHKGQTEEVVKRNEQIVTGTVLKVSMDSMITVPQTPKADKTTVYDVTDESINKLKDAIQKTQSSSK